MYILIKIHSHLNCVQVGVGISVYIRVLYFHRYHFTIILEHTFVALGQRGCTKGLRTQLRKYFINFMYMQR